MRTPSRHTRTSGQRLASSAGLTAATTRISKGARGLAVRLSGVLVVLVLWQLAFMTQFVSNVLLPAPAEVLDHLVRDVAGPRTVWEDIVATLTAGAIGLVVGAVTGGILGALVGRSAVLDDLVRPYVNYVNAVPRVALVPLFIVSLGIGIVARIALIWTLTFFATFYFLRAGVQSADRDLLSATELMGSSRRERWRLVIWPSAIPSMLTALRLDLGLALLGTVASEIVVSQAGIGYQISIRSASFDVSGIFSMLLLLGAITSIAAVGVRVLERRLLRWQQ